MKRTLKTLMVLAAFAGFASAANAASVVVSAGDGTYNQGEIITLTVTVTADAGDIDTSVFGVIQYQAAVVTPVALSQSQSALPNTASGPWSLGVLPACTTVNCRAFSQTNPGGGALTGPVNVVIATLQFTAIGPIGAVGTFGWQSAPVSQRLDFFGVTSAQGTSITIVPEPTTAAMLGLGLFGLALAGRRRA
jgi:hypothetical protein